MKRMLFAALAVATAVISSCTDQEDILHDSFSSLQVSVSGEDASRALEQGPAFPTGSRLGVSLFAVDGAPYEGRSDGYLNVPYVSRSQTGSDGVASCIWSSDTPILLSPAIGKVIAYYPYSASVNDLHAIPVDVKNSQDDAMYSGWVTGISALNPQASFSMKHALSGISLSFRKGGYSGAARVESVLVSSESFGHSASLDASSGDLSSLDGKDFPLAFEAPFTIAPEGVDRSLLVVPDIQVASPVFWVQMVVDTKTYTVRLPLKASLLQSKIYHFMLTLHDSKLAVSDVTITDWHTVDMPEGNLKP